MGNDHLDAQTSARLFRRAQAIKGGREALAQFLGVHPQDLARWTAGKAFPPQEIFDRVLEIILDAYASIGDKPPTVANVPRGRETQPSAKPRALVADSPEAFQVISAALGDEFDLVAVHTVDEALDILQGSAVMTGRAVDVIIAGLHLEHSQMLSFLQCVKAYPPTRNVPFICCRALPTQLSYGGGLAAMREACEALGALAYIDITEQGKRAKKEAAAVEFREAVRAAARLPRHAKNLRVLVVDDSADSAHTLSVLLRLLGYEVQKAESGSDALRTGADFLPDVIILDIAMPGMSGYAAAERIRTTSWGKHAVLVAITGYSSPEDIAKARQAGFDHHFAKPVTLEQMLEVFRRRA